MNRHLSLLTAALVAVLGAGAAQAATTTPAAKQQNCFLSNDWKSWSAPAAGKGDVLYLKVSLNDIYQVDLTPGSHAHKYPGAFLINQVRGSNWICSAIDLNLSLSDNQGFRQPLIAKSLHKLTPEEIAAIPRKDLP